MNKVAVLVVHGIGWHDDGTKRGLLEDSLTRLMDPPTSVALLEAALAKRLKDVDYVVKLAHWGKIIEVVQKRFQERYRELRWDAARRIVISALGDAAQYQAAIYSAGKQTFPTHQQIHGVVAQALAELAKACGDDAPLVAIGQSLGGHILSNHVYDEQGARASGAGPCHGGSSPLERMATLETFVTLGCNIPLFVMGTDAPTPIELDGMTWLNYYDPDDVLAFPLRPLYFPVPTAQSEHLFDISVEVGPLIKGATPLSHGYYWDNPKVVDDIAERIRTAATAKR